MKITLKRKVSDSDQDPLIVQYLEGPEGKQVKKTIAVKVGETLDLDDDLAIDILQKYKGMFVMGDSADAKLPGRGYAHKGRPDFQNKVPTAAQEG